VAFKFFFALLVYLPVFSFKYRVLEICISCRTIQRYFPPYTYWQCCGKIVPLLFRNNLGPRSGDCGIKAAAEFRNQLTSSSSSIFLLFTPNYSPALACVLVAIRNSSYSPINLLCNFNYWRLFSHFTGCTWPKKV